MSNNFNYLNEKEKSLGRVLNKKQKQTHTYTYTERERVKRLKKELLLYYIQDIDV